MDKTTAITKYDQPVVLPSKTKEATTQSHYRRRGLHFSCFLQNLDQNIQVYHPNLYRNFQSDSAFAVGKEEFGLKNSEKSNPSPHVIERKDQQGETYPKQKTIKEKKDALEKDDNIIVDPTRELDDPYKPGHANRENNPPIPEEKPEKDPKENTKTP